MLTTTSPFGQRHPRKFFDRHIDIGVPKTPMARETSKLAWASGMLSSRPTVGVRDPIP